MILFWLASLSLFIYINEIHSSATFMKLIRAKNPLVLLRVLRWGPNRAKLDKSQNFDSYFVPVYTVTNVLLQNYVLLRHKLPLPYLIVSGILLGVGLYGTLLDLKENNSIQRILRDGDKTPSEKAEAEMVHDVQIGKVVAFLVSFWVGTALAIVSISPNS